MDSGHQSGESGTVPVVTVMGHVDVVRPACLMWSKTVWSSGAGGITQHIGAYDVNTPMGQIVFPIPRHEAFCHACTRAMVTILSCWSLLLRKGCPRPGSVAHAKAANVPIIVAINKIDQEGANPDRVKQQLSEHGLCRRMGGIQSVNILGFESNRDRYLLEAILLRSCWN